MGKLSLVLSFWLAIAIQTVALAQSAKAPESHEKQNLEVLFRLVEKTIESAAEAMPADKYSFAPTNGEFRGVRIFADQIKHLAAANHILAAAALGEEPPADAGDETGPDTIHTKPEIIAYLKDSFDHLHKAIEMLDAKDPQVKSSPISPFQGGTATRMGLIVEALLHSYDHYGQMVEYLRMNGVIPPASRN
jgi:DinB superfamily